MENKHLSQLKTVAEYWKENTASRYMVAKATGIPLQNICRYVEMLKGSNSIAIIRKDYCTITGELVEYLSTDKNIFPFDNQLELF
jgi:DNA-binding transcriptional regulator LsrR (DeoR family)